MNKKIYFIGLGKMGLNMVTRLLKRGWSVSVFDVNPKAVGKARALGAEGLGSLDEIEHSENPKIVWLMIPAGNPVDDLLFGSGHLADMFYKGDVVIDGGNSFFEDTVSRAKKLKKRGLTFMDVGTSGGPGGALNGACLMVGGDKNDFSKLEPLFRDLAALDSYQHVGTSGAGHFVKMVHNGIEYGMMQAIGEGFELMKKSPFKLDLKKVADIYNHGSVIESRLTGWLLKAYEQYGTDLKGISGAVGHTGEGEWTAKTARKWKVPVPIIEGSFKFRVESAKCPSYTGQVLSALRNQFGGHDAAARKPKKKAGKKT